ncbi:MAG: peptidylprolyl isomerase [Bacteroidetes bacterium HGW-Bacteroidetes-21]|jgi:FKBP-type peptidyl-prolyl cis-trans isomerase SlyD|nr:MAG: peptidylprolyl isomerase [Bacteroidetes bacterium HGW-Bacteroidetes-21]
MKVEKGKVISVYYNMYLDSFEGEMVEAAEKTNPHVFLYDNGEMLQSFEKEIEGKTKGDTFKFELKAANAFGEYDPEAVMELPKDSFSVNGKFDSEVIFEGNMVPMKDQDGKVYEATILGVSDKTVRIDFNHPLAGEDLFIEGGIDEVREATADELAHGHKHDHADGEGCGCGCH